MATPVPAASNPMRPVLPPRGVAVVKSVLSGDTAVLIGRAPAPGARVPEVIFTFERVTAPRMASKANNNIDDPGAFPSREWLRNTIVGKSVTFETRKQGATAGDRVYGLLFMNSPSDPSVQINLAVESVRNGFATPKVFGNIDDVPSEMDAEDPSDPANDVDDYDSQLQSAFQEAKMNQVGVHSVSPSPIIRELKNSGDDFGTLELVEKCKKFCTNGMVKCVIEYIFDGSRYRLSVTDEQMEPAGLLHSSFTLILAGIAAPRIGNPRLDPPTDSEPHAEEAKQFVEMRLLHRELYVTLHGTDKSGVCGVGTIHHPKGNIGIELLKNGLGKMSDWSARMMNPLDVPAFRIAENDAKRTNKRVWKSYQPPQLTGASEITGVVVEVLTGDTLSILPQGVPYDSESRLKRISLASVRSPRLGNEKIGKADEPYAFECKERLRILTVGKSIRVDVHYEKDITMGQGTETRQYGTVSTSKKSDIGEVLVSEGLAVTQRHRDDDEKSPSYDELCAAENAAKAAKKGVHSPKEYKKAPTNDLTDPRKAKAYSGALMRAGNIKAVVEHSFNGSRFKLFVPSENCHIVFALQDLRCPQPSPVSTLSNRGQVKAAEPFGDASKRNARMTVHQRTVEINCKGVTMGGVITGSLFVGQGGQRKNFALEQVGAGLAVVDQRKIDYGEAPKVLIDAQSAAQRNRTGIWSQETQKVEEKKPALKGKEMIYSVSLSEICDGHRFFVTINGDEAIKVVNDSMGIFTAKNGLSGAPCDLKIGKIVAALFDDGTGKKWYRARIVEKKVRGKATVLFVDYGNKEVVPTGSHLRPLDPALDVSRIPAVAKEAELALVNVRSLEDDDGIDAARTLSRLAWGRKMEMRVHCEMEGKLKVTLVDPEDISGGSVNEQLVLGGLATVAKKSELNAMSAKMVSDNSLIKLSADLSVAQESARKMRKGMWRYGDIGDSDDEEY